MNSFNFIVTQKVNVETFLVPVTAEDTLSASTKYYSYSIVSITVQFCLGFKN